MWRPRGRLWAFLHFHWSKRFSSQSLAIVWTGPKVGCIESCAIWVDDCESVALRDKTISFIRKRCEDDTENTSKDFEHEWLQIWGKKWQIQSWLALFRKLRELGLMILIYSTKAKSNFVRMKLPQRWPTTITMVKKKFLEKITVQGFVAVSAAKLTQVKSDKI